MNAPRLAWVSHSKHNLPRNPQNLPVREMRVVQSNQPHDLLSQKRVASRQVFQQELRRFAFCLHGRGERIRGG